MSEQLGDDRIEDAAEATPEVVTAPAGSGAGPWKAMTIVLAVVCLGLAVALGRPTSAPSAAPQATVTVTVEADGAGADAQPTETGVSAEQVAWLLDLPRRDVGDPRAKGDVDAPVVLTEWADHRCPFCSVWAEDTLPLLQPFVDEGIVRIEFRDLAIFGEDSVNAAAGTRAAGEQGLFWEFQHALFVATPNQGHPDVGHDLVEEIALQVGIPDLERFLADYHDQATRDAVLAESVEAQQMGISSTPTFLVGSEVISGAQPFEVFEAVIREQAALHA